MRDNCADHESLSAYVDGELDSAAVQDLESHISVCESCTARLEEVKRLRILFSPLRDEWAPINVVDAVRAQLQNECSCGWGWRRLAVLPLVLLSFAALLLGIELGKQLTAPNDHPPTAALVRLAPFAAIPPGNLCVNDSSCNLEGKI